MSKAQEDFNDNYFDDNEAKVGSDKTAKTKNPASVQAQSTQFKFILYGISVVIGGAILFTLYALLAKGKQESANSEFELRPQYLGVVPIGKTSPIPNETNQAAVNISTDGVSISANSGSPYVNNREQTAEVEALQSAQKKQEDQLNETKAQLSLLTQKIDTLSLQLTEKQNASAKHQISATKQLTSATEQGHENSSFQPKRQSTKTASVNVTSQTKSSEKSPVGSYRIRVITPNGETAQIENVLTKQSFWVTKGDNVPNIGIINKIDAENGEVGTASITIN